MLSRYLEIVNSLEMLLRNNVEITVINVIYRFRREKGRHLTTYKLNFQVVFLLYWLVIMNLISKLLS